MLLKIHVTEFGALVVIHHQVIVRATCGYMLFTSISSCSVGHTLSQVRRREGDNLVH